MSSIEAVLARHCHILANVEALETLAAGPYPARLDGIAFRRWAFTRDLLLHFARMEGEVYGPMMDDGRPEAARRASAASAETAALVADFREHAGRWYVFPLPAQWPIYQRSVAWLMGRIRARIEAEATQIVPLLPARPVVTALRGPRENYVAEAWALRELIFPMRVRSADNDGEIAAA